MMNDRTMASNENVVVPWDDDNEEIHHHKHNKYSNNDMSQVVVNRSNNEGDDDDDDGAVSTIDTYEDGQIRLSQDKFYGRDEELSKLVELYQHHIGRKSTTDGEREEGSTTATITTATSPAEVVLVGGSPGTGKTTLVQKFVTTARSLADSSTSTSTSGHHGCKPFYFLSGKYEELQRADPLSALVEAFSGLVRELQQSNSDDHGTGGPTERKRIRTNIISALGENHSNNNNQNNNDISGDGAGSDTNGEGGGNSSSGAGADNQKVLIDLIPDLKVILEGGDDHAAAAVLPPNEDGDISSPDAATASSTPTQQQEQHQQQSQSLPQHSSSPPDAVAVTATAEVEDSLNRIKYIFQLFVKAVCTSQRPIILFLDDLQWADKLSLDLLSTLLMDQDLQHLLFVGAYRSNEVNNTTNMTGSNLVINHPFTSSNNDNINNLHPFASWIQTIEHDRRNLPPVHRIELENHSHEAIADCIADILGMKQHEITELAKFVFKKTEGNMFFVLQALQELRRQNIIKFSSTTREWEWDESDVELGAVLSDNVVEVVVGKLQSLPSQLQVTLSIAAFLRSAFDIATLFALIQERRKNTSNTTMGEDKDEETTLDVPSHVELIRLLDVAVVEGLLENCIGSSSYKFTHDKIQEAAYCLVSSNEERDKMRLQVGKFLVARAMSTERDDGGTRGAGSDDWMLFVAADHLNSIDDASSSLDNVNPLDVAKLNLQVGKKAVKVAAFSSASQYFLRGISALHKLSSSPWETQYDITYEMYNSSASVLLALGTYSVCVKHSQEILNHAKTLAEKFPAYWSMEGSLSRQQRHREALELNQKVAERLGAYPKRFRNLQLVRAFLEVKKLFRKHSDEEILQVFPVMTDPTELAVMRFLSRIALRALLCDNSVVLLLATLRQIIHTFRYGLCGEGAYAVASYGMILCGSLGHVEAGKRMGPLAKNIRKRCNARLLEAKVCTIVTHYIDAWTMPLTQVLDSFQKGFQAGMETGDVEFACWNSACGNWTAYHAGYPLATLLETGNGLLSHLVQFNVTSICAAMYPLIKFYQYLMGSKQPNWDTVALSHRTSDDDEAIGLTFDLLTHCYLAYFFGRYELSEQLLERWFQKKQSAPDRAYINISTTFFFRGLIAAAMGRTTGKSKYRSIARKASKKMREMVRWGSVTDVHRSYILDAEVSASFEGGGSRPKGYLVEQKFELSISAATESGFVQDAALANELAGEYFLRVGQDRKASIHLTVAHGLYQQWGARAKSELLREQRKDHIIKDNTPSTDAAASVASDAKSRQVLYTSWGNSRGVSGTVDLDELSRRMGQTASVQTGNDESLEVQ